MTGSPPCPQACKDSEGHPHVLLCKCWEEEVNCQLSLQRVRITRSREVEPDQEKLRKTIWHTKKGLEVHEMVGIRRPSGLESSVLGGSWFREVRSLSGSGEPASSQGATSESGAMILSSRRSRARSSLKIGAGKDDSSVSIPQSQPSKPRLLRACPPHLTVTVAVSSIQMLSDAD